MPEPGATFPGRRLVVELSPVRLSCVSAFSSLPRTFGILPLCPVSSPCICSVACCFQAVGIKSSFAVLFANHGENIVDRAAEGARCTFNMFEGEDAGDAEEGNEGNEGE